MASKDLFDLTGRVTVITGGAGLLGMQHAEAIASAGGIPVLVDLLGADPEGKAGRLAESTGAQVLGRAVDITQPEGVKMLTEELLSRFGQIDILINNAAHNPKMESTQDSTWTRFENFPLDGWNADIAVALTGAFLCSQSMGSAMARRGRGVILNIASDLSIIAPDQRLYQKEGVPPDQQPVKPVTYSVVKTALVGLTRYLATYWAESGVRVNALSPGGVFNDQPPEFVKRLNNLIPMGRMAHMDEYKGAVLYLCSDASSYMTGVNLVVDGGRSCW